LLWVGSTTTFENEKAIYKATFKLMLADPDSYWVEIIGQKPIEETENVTETSTETYRMVC
jgi:hypothetical protein